VTLAARGRRYVRSMPRPQRDQEPGYFHVTTRGNNRRDIFLTADDRRVFLALLGRIALEREWLLQTWCLMTNHFHLVLETRHANLSAGMQRVNGVYAQWFNAWHGRTGHLFGRRFWSKRIEGETQLRDTAEYVFHNPVRAGLCADPWDWRWSGGVLFGERRWPPMGA
jgi:REP element-mobilizing transposase RayT